jgi:hypothetical protein
MLAEGTRAPLESATMPRNAPLELCACIPAAQSTAATHRIACLAIDSSFSGLFIAAVNQLFQLWLCRRDILRAGRITRQRINGNLEEV